MIAYDRAGLDALLIRDAAQEWCRQGLLSEEQWLAVQAQHKSGFYSPNVFVRIGLAIFTLVLLSAALGLGALISDLNSETGFALLCLFFGLVLFLMLELWIIGSARHYGSGVDDMLLYFGTSLLLGGLYMLMPSGSQPLDYACVTLPFLVVGSIRYLDRLMTAAAFGYALMILMLLLMKSPQLALFAMPFAGMLFAGGVYFLARHGQSRYAWRHWHSALAVLELLAIVLFYVSGNYWVVQQAGYGWFQIEQPPIAWFFWIFTFAVPLAYLYFGLRRKDRLMLDVGLGCVAVAVFTYRAYFHVMPLAWAAVLGGAVLFAVAYFSIRHLRKTKGVYTYDADADKTLLQEIEQQLIAQHLAQQPAPAPNKDASLGGGQFGGGGADGQF
ncbi:MAG: hypothetical protein JNJ90_17235 [Saprospiraceae bacterium]|jgi:hypothetical protein|nr:hypothetical protein [Saprospiraceae bacterium]